MCISRIPLFCALSSVVVLLAAGIVLSAEEELGYILDHKTLYVAPGVDGAHRFEVKGAIKGVSGTGTLVIDKNACTLNQFGDRTVCTLVAYTAEKVEFKLLRLTDPSMQGREIYSVSGPGLPKEHEFRLIIGRKSSPEVLRLVVHHAKEHSAFPLVPQAEYDKAP
jgi:hypothetical protein